MALMFRPLARYADFQGRARRSEYWLWALFLFLCWVGSIVIQFFVMMIVAAAGAADQHGTDGRAAALVAVGIMTLVRIVFWLAVLIPSAAVAVRRMHDTNRSGWWIVMPYLVWLVAFTVALSLNGTAILDNIKRAGNLSEPTNTQATYAFMGSLMLSMLWVLLAFLAAKIVTFIFRVTEGTAGSNRFGPNPKGVGGNIDVF